MSNQAKDWQKGYYTVLVDGKTIAVSKKVKTEKNELGFPTYKHVTVTSQCAPEDEFDLSMGVALAMDRLSKELSKGKIEVGDKVKIKDDSLIYDVYTPWVTKNIHDITEVARYAYHSNPDTNYTYKVIAVAPHNVESRENLAYIKEIDGVFSPCYLISVDGLEKV